MRRQLSAEDVEYLSNLCHNCGACYYDCQYAPPHEFAVNVPSVLSGMREEVYARYAWPSFLAPLYKANGVKIAMIAAMCVAVFLLGFILMTDSGSLFASGAEEGAFYRAMPHNTMVLVFGSIFIYAIAAISISVRRYWLATGAGGSLAWVSIWQASKDVSKLRYLDGGGMGCMHENEKPSNARRMAHHFTFYGFLLCLASTTSGTLLHYLFGMQAPYPFFSPTVILGTLGGIGLIIGPLGLLMIKRRSDDALRPSAKSGMDTAFLLMLLFTSITGLVLMVLRATPAMGIILAIHLGVVFALFLTMPYGKFVHGLYRYAALIRYANEQGLSKHK